MLFKEWLKFNENLEGEYWIDNQGQSMYADGDIGDYGHEAYAMAQAQSEIADMFNVEHDEDWEETLQNIVQEIMDSLEESERTRIEAEDMWPGELILWYFKKEGEPNIKQWKDLIDVANGKVDAREYAIQYWGWKRVVGNHIESWKLTPQDMKIIANGIDDILGQQYDLTDDQIRNMTFYINTYTGPSYEVTLDQLHSGRLHNPQSQRQDINKLSQAATAQVRQQDIQGMHPAYWPKDINPFKRNINPFGESVK